MTETDSKAKTDDKKKKRGKRRRFLRAIVLLVVLGVIAAGGGVTYFHFGPPDNTCLSCHEIRPSYDTWAASAHREVHCRKCHGSSLSGGFDGLKQHAGEVRAHFSREPFDEIRVSEARLVEMIGACRSCHESEFAGWLSGGHSLTYTDVFLNEKHNRTEQPFDDCLRCHGMFFEGTIREVVAPPDTTGPWKLVNPTLADRPAIPCMACHKMHSTGKPAQRPDYSDPARIASMRASTSPTLHFYDRYEKTHFHASDLPHARMVADRQPVETSPDPRQRVCVQCHAPESTHEVGTSDDRTPTGVHEGLSCRACHSPHSNETRASCAACHPAWSNCSLDVEQMDTTFASPDSPHDVHFVGCEDCHPGGIEGET